MIVAQPKSTAPPMRLKKSYFSLIAIYTFLLAAFFLRVYHLETTSLWYDEAFSIYLSRLDLATITARTAADIHPPLYYYLLHFWLQLAGPGEFAVRYLSLFFGVLTVPLIAKLTDQLWGRRWPIAPPIAAWLASLSPVYIWYSQEARMYTLTIYLATAGLYCFTKILGMGAEKPSAGVTYYVLFVVANAAATYAHFYALFVVAAEALFVCGLWLVRIGLDKNVDTSDQKSISNDTPKVHPLSFWERAKVRIVPFKFSMTFPTKQNINSLALTGAFSAIILAYLPWSGYAYTRLGTDTSYYQGTIDIWTILSETFTLFATGHTGEPSSAIWGAIGFLTLASAGLFAAVYSVRLKRSGSSAASVGLLLLCIVIPIILLYSISYNRPKFHPRYLLLASPPYFIFIAICLAATCQSAFTRTTATNRRKRLLFPLLFFVAILTVVTFWIRSLENLYFDSTFGRDDWRAVS
ncbi:MAG: glycosyltransferase family 39 protein, partial [Actinobacteria bacterium]|nr:glycosyltransferase family 39 protein [Actinomycetota bacterium]